MYNFVFIFIYCSESDINPTLTSYNYSINLFIIEVSPKLECNKIFLMQNILNLIEEVMVLWGIINTLNLLLWTFYIIQRDKNARNKLYLDFDNE
jgi:hypothetical protein